MFLKNYTTVDLTHPLTPTIPTWEGSCGFTITTTMDYPQGCRAQELHMRAGIGTHMDAPAHFFKNAPDISQLSLAELMVPACVINVSGKATADYRISVDDIATHEKNYGTISANSLVIGYTGWDRFWHNPNAYRNQGATGHMQFPGFSPEAARLLIQRNIAGIAIDTLSPDGSDLTFPVHKTILGAGKYIIENIANANQLPAQSAYVIALPLAICQSSEAPARVIGFVPTKVTL